MEQPDPFSSDWLFQYVEEEEKEEGIRKFVVSEAATFGENESDNAPFFIQVTRWFVTLHP